MDGVYVVLLGAITSAGAWLALRRRPAYAGRRLRAAFARVAEWAGLTVLLLALNLAAGFALVVLLRAASGRFVSMYVNTDVTLLVVSALQAVAVQWWREQ